MEKKFSRVKFVQKCILSAEGKLSPFSFQRGIRQGCALSGMLYNLSVEPLLALLRTSVFGASLSKNSKVVVSAYADDICVAVSNQKDVCEVSRCLTQLELASAARLRNCYGTLELLSRVNWNNSVAFLVGLRPPSLSLPVLPGGMQCSCEGFKYFGLFLGIEAYEQKNWENFLEQIKLKLARWKRLHHLLSLKTWVTIINNLVVP